MLTKSRKELFLQKQEEFRQKNREKAAHEEYKKKAQGEFDGAKEMQEKGEIERAAAVFSEAGLTFLLNTFDQKIRESENRIKQEIMEAVDDRFMQVARGLTAGFQAALGRANAEPEESAAPEPEESKEAPPNGETSGITGEFTAKNNIHLSDDSSINGAKKQEVKIRIEKDELEAEALPPDRNIKMRWASYGHVPRREILLHLALIHENVKSGALPDDISKVTRQKYYDLGSWQSGSLQRLERTHFISWEKIKKHYIRIMKKGGADIVAIQKNKRGHG